MAAGKGGGSWKVAYADFVTALMAFFLVMWIGAQDSKTRRAVAEYFLQKPGAASTPPADGGLFRPAPAGPGVAPPEGALGARVYSQPDRPSHPTAVVARWAAADPDTLARWREAARRVRAAAAVSPDVKARTRSPKDVAADVLARELRDDVTRDTPALEPGVHRELLFDAALGVNWRELAEELLRD